MSEQKMPRPAPQPHTEKSDKEGRTPGNDDRGTLGGEQAGKPAPPDATPSDKEPGRKGDQPA